MKPMRNWVLRSAPPLTGWQRPGTESERVIGRSIDAEERRVSAEYQRSAKRPVRRSK